MRTTRRFVLHTLLLLGCALPDASAAETLPPAATPFAVAPPVTQRQPEVFPLGFWLGPPQAANTVESYRRIKDCGFTLAFVGFGAYTKDDYRKTLDICQSIGLKAVLYMHEDIWRAYAQGIDWRAIPAERAAEFGQHPALAGWGLLDEPRAEHFPELAAWNLTLGERTPGKLRFTNLLPHGCPPEQTGAQTYEDYVETFLSTVKPDVLCFDHYVLVKEGAHGRHHAPLFGTGRGPFAPSAD